MYLLYSIRPDIAFAISQLSKHDLDLRMGNMRAEKKVICYLKGTMHLGLVYRAQPKDDVGTKPLIASSLFRIIGYRDNSYAGEFKDKMLIIGYHYYINKAIISWYGKKPNSVDIN